MNVQFRSLFFLLLATLISGCQLNLSVSAEEKQAENSATTILVFSKTTGFRHNSIPDANAFLRQHALDNGWSLVATEDAAAFNDDNLANFDAVVFLLTTGDVLNDTQQAAFERYIQAGGGYVGIHSASDTEYDWPWYGGLIGGYFNGHPRIQKASMDKDESPHPSTEFLPDRWELEDEWYNFSPNPADSSGIHVLLWLDETTYSGGTMGDSHPIAWAQEYDGGRAWYTGLGHRDALYTDEAYALFQQHVIAGIEWAAEDDPIVEPTPTQTPIPTITPTPNPTPISTPTSSSEFIFLPWLNK